MKAARWMLAVLALPVMVIVVIPTLVVWLTGARHVGWSLAAPWSWLLVAFGVLLVAAGAVVALSTVVLFARYGDGTAAPWDPPTKFVVRGPYRYVRNPMIAAVFLILAGEAVVLGSWAVAAWFAVFVVANLLYIPLSEEPALAQRFGDDYQRYRQNVPRWIPRVKPWADKG